MSGQAGGQTAGAAAPIRIAALQMVSGPRVAENLAQVDALAAEAVGRGAALIALPEYYPIFGLTEDAKLKVREVFGEGPIQAHLAALARRHRVWVVGGSLPLAASVPDKVLNTTLVYSPAGECVARYDKIHLFAFRMGAERYDEAASIAPGNAVVAFDTPIARIGLSICYDLRFPELFRAMGRPDLIVVPAAFTETTGRAHWEILLRARAIENQCYVLAVAQGGHHENGRLTHGNSMIVDPWGEVLDRLPKGAGVVIADFDRERIRDVRERLPALEHRTM